MWEIFLTLDVSKLDKSIEVIFEQLLNKDLIFWTDEVFIFPKFIVSKFEHRWNIAYMLITFDVSNEDKSIEFIFEHPEKINSNYSTEDVFIFPNLIVSKFVQSLNI